MAKSSDIRHGNEKTRRPREVGPFWKFYSLKSKKVVLVRGDFLYYLAILLESDPFYAGIRYPPNPLDRHRKNTPSIDLVAVDDEGNEYVFYIHYSNSYNTNNDLVKSLRNQEIAQKTCELQNMRFVVTSDRLLLRDAQALANYSHIQRFLSRNRNYRDSLLCKQIESFTNSKHGISISEILVEFSNLDTDLLFTNIFFCITEGAIRADLNTSNLSKSTLVYGLSPIMRSGHKP